ncbi:LPS export ABC transporter permease LptF [Sulfurivermis fontis]|uniref:LPS export ABC transporter permease LptF n=1 Tax=Sulfurivermis fontis TaxID=1972068 RepID=UPI0015597BCF|nr:LPS export ABC transporter permease LptF [Sulfurivermis fontis]
MIIRRYLLREIAATFAGVALLLSLIVLSGTFVRVLSEVVEGTYPADVMLELFALKSSANLVFIMPLTFFLSVLLALGRLYRDSEMTVLFACGIGPQRIYRSVGLLSLLVALVLGALALLFVPWTKERAARLQDEAGARSEIEGLTAGRFNLLGEGGLLVYLEGISDDRREMIEVFSRGEMDARQQVLSAARAQQQEIDGDRYLVFYDGYRYDGQPGTPDFRVIQFREHGIRLQEREVVASERPRQALPVAVLWRSGAAADMAELQWRLTVPLSTLVFGLLAVPLSRSSPREGRYGRLAEAILIYIVYSYLIFAAKSALARGEISPWLGLWWVHGLGAALLLVILWRQRRLPGPRRKAVHA